MIVRNGPLKRELKRRLAGNTDGGRGDLPRLMRAGREYADPVAYREHPHLSAYFHRHPPVLGECYHNCQSVLAHDTEGGGLDYCEGFVTLTPTGSRVCHHAWLVGADGSLYDPTFEVLAARFPAVWFPRRYVGLVIPRLVVLQSLHETGLAVALLSLPDDI